MEYSNKTELGKKINILIRMKYSYKEFSKISDISIPYLIKIRRGQDIHIKYYKKAFKALGIKLNINYTINYGWKKKGNNLLS